MLPLVVPGKITFWGAPENVWISIYLLIKFDQMIVLEALASSPGLFPFNINSLCTVCYKKQSYMDFKKILFLCKPVEIFECLYWVECLHLTSFIHFFAICFCGNVCIFKNQSKKLYFRMWRAGIWNSRLGSPTVSQDTPWEFSGSFQGEENLAGGKLCRKQAWPWLLSLIFHC